VKVGLPRSCALNSCKHSKDLLIHSSHKCDECGNLFHNFCFACKSYICRSEWSRHCAGTYNHKGKWIGPLCKKIFGNFSYEERKRDLRLTKYKGLGETPKKSDKKEKEKEKGKKKKKYKGRFVRSKEVRDKKYLALKLKYKEEDDNHKKSIEMYKKKRKKEKEEKLKRKEEKLKKGKLGKYSVTFACRLFANYINNIDTRVNKPKNYVQLMKDHKGLSLDKDEFNEFIKDNLIWNPCLESFIIRDVRLVCTDEQRDSDDFENLMDVVVQEDVVAQEEPVNVISNIENMMIKKTKFTLDEYTQKRKENESKENPSKRSKKN
jgi:hypothetical protein